MLHRCIRCSCIYEVHMSPKKLSATVHQTRWRAWNTHQNNILFFFLYGTATHMYHNVILVFISVSISFPEKFYFICMLCFVPADVCWRLEEIDTCVACGVCYLPPRHCYHMWFTKWVTCQLLMYMIIQWTLTYLATVRPDNGQTSEMARF